MITASLSQYVLTNNSTCWPLRLLISGIRRATAVRLIHAVTRLSLGMFSHLERVDKVFEGMGRNDHTKIGVRDAVEMRSVSVNVSPKNPLPRRRRTCSARPERARPTWIIFQFSAHMILIKGVPVLPSYVLVVQRVRHVDEHV